MTPHQTQTFLDGSVAIKIWPGGKWKVWRFGEDVYECTANQFVAEQNKHIKRSHRETVTKVRRDGRP